MKTKLGGFMQKHQITTSMTIGMIVLLSVLIYVFSNGDWSGFSNIYLK